MKKYYLLFFFSIFFQLVYGQCDTTRYLQPIFESITAHEDVQYGSATVWNIPYNQTDLKMNIYTPDNDSLTYRPLVLWAHPGGFLLGDKDLEDMVALCDSFARRGYVTATIDYRKGFNPTSASSAERAVYRGVQDMRAAIRFLKEHYDVYGIDTNYTFIGGSSAGAFSVLHTVYMDQNEAPTSIAAGTGYPALGCLDCEGNDFSHEMDISGYVSLWGAIGDSTWINGDETTPGLLVHGTADGTVPFGVGHPFGAPTTPKTHGSRTISNQLNALSIPHTTYFVEGEGHEFHGTSNGTWVTPPTPYWDTIFNMIETHFYTILQSETLPIDGPSYVCTNDTVTYTINSPMGHTNCWEITNGEIVSIEDNQVQVVHNQVGETQIQVRQFSETGVYNGVTVLTIEVREGTMVDFSHTIADLTVSFTPNPIGFVNYNWDFGDGNTAGSMAPTHNYASAGVYEVSLTATATNGCSSTAVKEVDVSTLSLEALSNSTLEVYPNPSDGKVLINSAVPISRLTVYSMNGQEVGNFTNMNGHIIDLSNLSHGMYYLKIEDVEGKVVLHKLLIEQ